MLLDRVYGIEPFPSVADVFYLGGMGMIAVAVLWLAKGRIPGGDRASLLDALIVAVGVGMLSWVFVMAPIVADETQSFGEIAVALAYPLLDIALLGVLVRLVLQPGAQPMSLRLLIAALVAFLVSDFPYAMMSLTGGYETGNIVDLGWMVGAVLWGTAALHPSMLSIADPVERSTADQFSALRLLLLVAASLMGPAVLVYQWANGEPIDVPVIAAGCVTIFLLVIMRLGTVVDALRATLDERSVLEHELERRALHDPLTGLANRTLFHDRLGHALARRSGSVAVMFLDLDDFKTVNDAYGHAAGDKVLRAVADALHGAVRAEDTVARLGGDEFAVLLDDSPDRYEAALVAGRLLGAVQVPVHLAGYQHAIGVSIGISLGSGGEASAESLMRDADIAMYVAKGQGKGTFTVFEPTEHHAVVRGLELRTDLDRAIRQREFELHYQPILSLETGAVAGVEALVRWRHPTPGPAGPGRVHLAGRGDRRHHPARRMDPGGGVHRGSGLVIRDRWVARPRLRQRQPVSRAAGRSWVRLHPRADHAGHRPLAAPAGAGGDRERASRSGRGGRHVASGAGRGHPPGDRRLRHRLRRPGPAGAHALRPRQDRALVRDHHRDRSTGRVPGGRDRGPRAAPGRRGRGRGNRGWRPAGAPA